MRIAKLLPGAFFLLVAACASVAPQPSGMSVYVMRHLQKDAGVDPALSAEGKAHAAALWRWFDSDPPRAIYVSTTRRAAETAAPLAAKLGIVPKVYDPSDTPGLVARVKEETGTVLVVGHSNTVPDIVQQLGGARPADIGDDRYGDIWHVVGADHIVLAKRIYE